MPNQTVLAPGGAAPTDRLTPVTLPEILRLLDDTGLTFTLHTHHPGTHLEYGQQAPADPWANTRRECPEAPVAGTPGREVLG
jgi:hypothetical protein